MSAPSATDPTSRMKIVCVPCERMGMSFRPLKSPTTELTGTIGMRAPVRKLPDGATLVAGSQRPHHLVRRHVVGTQLIGIQANENGALARAERRRCRHAWQGREQRAHLEERRVLKLRDMFCLAAGDAV